MMDEKDIFKNIYLDFFGTSKLEKENEALRKELHLEDKDIPEIQVNRKEDSDRATDTVEASAPVAVEKTEEEKIKEIEKFYERIDKLYISEKSKETLRKMVDYIKNYHDKKIREYISFNLCLYTINKETLYEVLNIINDVTIYFEYVERGDACEVSFFNVEKVETIEDIYNKENSIILFKNIEGMVAQDQNFKSKFWHALEEKYAQNEKKYLTVLVAKTKDIVNQAFEGNLDIKNDLFNFEIEEIKPDVQDVYQEILNKLEVNGKWEDEFPVKLLDYITVTYPKSELSFPNYRDKLCEKILFNMQDIIKVSDIPEYEKDKSIEEIFAELNELVGLASVKNTLNDLVSLMELKSKTQNDLKIKNTNLHMVFLGNPGTGKTTVARLVAQILYNLKYIKKNSLIEVSSKDLVGEYVGQTAPKTMSVIEKAMGGVLFIDEAYTLASSGNSKNSYNEEAIATIIQAMENYRDDIVVIFAGYTKEMQAFLDSNSGIVSRIGYTLNFEDYSEEELVKIFKNMLTKSGFEVTQSALNKAKDIFTEYKTSKNFGNARFARNLYEKTVIQHATNTKDKKNKKALKTIDEKDISTKDLLK